MEKNENHTRQGHGDAWEKFLSDHPGIFQHAGEHAKPKEWKLGAISKEELLGDEKDVEDFRDELWNLKEAIGEEFNAISPDKFSKADLVLLLPVFEKFKEGTATHQELSAAESAYGELHKGSGDAGSGFYEMCAWIEKQLGYQDDYERRAAGSGGTD